MTMMAAHKWPTNGELIADVACLYLDKAIPAADVTYGRGLWWTNWRPNDLVCHDLKIDGVDFRKLPESDETFGLVAFDPPYVAMGGRDTSGLPDFMDRFGLKEAPKTPAENQRLNDEGLHEVARVLRRRGICLAKCCDYISSGKLWEGTYWTQQAAHDFGFEVLDRIEHIGHVRAQPPGRRQVHARRNLSTLFVLRKR